MGFDLMNLKEPYRSGKLISRTEKSAELLFPLARISFPRLSKPHAMEDGQKERFSISMIWNVKDPKKPAFVNLNQPVAGFEKDNMTPGCLWTALKRFADEQKIGHTLKPEGGLNPFLIGQKYRQSDGSPLDGYGPETVSASFSKYPSGARSVVKCYGPTGEEIDPERIEENAGFYGRVRGQLYVNKPGKGYGRKVCLGLISVQLIANGERFGGEPTDTGFEEVEGASIDPTNDGGFDGGFDAGDDNISF
jgi:hypothetical protein